MCNVYIYIFNVFHLTDYLSQTLTSIMTFGGYTKLKPLHEIHP